VDGGEREEITSAGIARLAGVGRAAVSNWRKRYAEFPKPVGGSPNSPTFDRGEVLRWLKETGKGDQLATAGQTDGGTLRVSSREADRFEDSFNELFAAAWKRLPERSVTDLSGRELLARTMVALLPRSIVAHDDPAQYDDAASGTQRPVVLDPACGTGLLLIAAADRFGDRVRLAGQELNEGAARIAAFNLGGNAGGAEYEVHAGDSLLDDQLGGYQGQASAVVCEPPFDRPDWPVAALTTDPRWEFGIPAPRDSELAWAQHCYAHLRPYGVAVVAVSRRTCVQPSGEHVRAALIRSGALRAVIALPAGMSSVPGTDISLWVLRRPGGAAAPRGAAMRAAMRAPVRLADLSGLGDPADVPLEYAAWQQLFDAGDRTVVRPVERLELLDEGASLLPSRYLAPRGEASAADLAKVTGRLAEIYATVGRGLPRFAAPKVPAALRAQVTLAELERAGALLIRARDDTPRAGDVLLRTLGRMPVVATGTAADSGVAQVVEIDPARLDPHFVAVFLRADVAALPVANTLGAINRDDLRRCRIPRLPLAEQRAYGAAFAHLTELEQALTRLSDLSAKVIEQTIDSLTSGAVAPDYLTRSEGEKRQ
jgi:SAM-dependent methyltransferase